MPEMKNATIRRDAMRREAEKQDLADHIASGRRSPSRPQRPTSILLSDDLKEAPRRRGQELGVGYQTVAKVTQSGGIQREVISRSLANYSHAPRAPRRP